MGATDPDPVEPPRGFPVDSLPDSSILAPHPYDGKRKGGLAPWNLAASMLLLTS